MKDLKIKLPRAKKRLELLLAGLSGKRDVKELCQEAGISRPLYYRWLDRLKKRALETLKASEPGPGNREDLSPEKARKLEAKVEELRKRLAASEKQREHLELVVKTAKGIIRRQGWGEVPDFKKNGTRERQSGKSTGESGNPAETKVSGREQSQNASGSTGQPTGDGSRESPSLPGSEK